MKKNFKIVLLLIFSILITPGCVKKSKLANNSKQKDLELLPYEKRLLKKEKQLEKKSSTKKTSSLKNNSSSSKKELDFNVKNKTGKTIYVACFSYINKRNFARWRWDKSPIYKLENNQSQIIDIDTIKDEINRKKIFGALGVFNTLQEAQDSTYELLSEKNRLDLDKLYKLQDKTVKIDVELYGFKKNFWEVSTAPDIAETINELDFRVKNQTGKNLWVCCFVYQKKEEMSIWRYDKTELKLLKNNESMIIDIDSIVDKYDRVHTLGFLGIFEEKDKEEAENATYELLKPENKIALGKLSALNRKEIIIETEKYGFKNDFLDISIKPIRRIYK
ncbi:MAG: hypothetical protein ABIF12_03760 [bacterium]